MAELGRRVSLSAPAVGERVQRLEESGVITGYSAVVDPRAIGYPIAAIVRIRPARRQLHKVPEVARSTPEVVECHRVTGEDCYVAKLHLRSMDDLEGILDRFAGGRADDHVDRALGAGCARGRCRCSTTRPTEPEAPHRRCATIPHVALTPRQQKKRQMVRAGYGGIGVGALLVILAVTGAGLVLGLIGAIVLLVSGWATRALRDL